ncbi:MAG: protein adenylyltransferase SelO family protein, partial [Pseudomonadota bacterium]
NGQRFDIQLKGSGTSKFSRQGDGKSPLGPVLREYVVSEAMHALGIPTTRALCAVSTGEPVHRETSLPGGVFTRVASSHLRVGTFEYFMRQGDVESLRTIFNYASQRHMPDLDPSSDDAPEIFLASIRDRFSDLVAQWMSVGFIHGVMNTDNTSLAGITIDYGPCAFMDEFRSDQVFSYIDRQGRYAFSNQPRIALWNLERLAECLIPLMNAKGDLAVQKMTDVLAKFESAFMNSWLSFHRGKFGFEKPFEDEVQLYQDWFQVMESQKYDFTLSFLDLEGRLLGRNNSMTIKPHPEAEAFVAKWKTELARQGLSLETAAKKMAQTNPRLIPRNHLVEMVIRRAYQGSFEEFQKLCELTTRPFAKVEDIPDVNLQPPKEDERISNTFCGT